MKPFIITAVVAMSLLTFGCKENKQAELQAIFPKGELGSAENFTGNAMAYCIGCK